MGSTVPEQAPHRRRFDQLTTAELYDILRLRSDVFVVEQACAYADVDGRDTEAGTMHWWYCAGGSVAAYARSMHETDGSVRIGRVVTASAARGTGLAARLVTAIVESHPRSTVVVLDAQQHLSVWYEHLGFEVTGTPFIDDGIAHVPMRYVWHDAPT